MTYEELTVDLPKAIEQAFILSPGYIGADSLDLERFIVTVWKAPVTMDNYKAVAQSFRQWYKEHAPDEYHDPPDRAAMSTSPAVDGLVLKAPWGGVRTGATGRPRGIPNPNGGRKTLSPNGHSVARNVTLDPDVYRQVAQYATANGLSFSAGLNALLSKKELNHEHETIL